MAAVFIRRPQVNKIVNEQNNQANASPPIGIRTENCKRHNVGYLPSNPTEKTTDTFNLGERVDDVLPSKLNPNAMHYDRTASPNVAQAGSPRIEPEPAKPGRTVTKLNLHP